MTKEGPAYWLLEREFHDPDQQLKRKEGASKLAQPIQGAWRSRVFWGIKSFQVGFEKENRTRLLLSVDHLVNWGLNRMNELSEASMNKARFGGSKRCFFSLAYRRMPIPPLITPSRESLNLPMWISRKLGIDIDPSAYPESWKERNLLFFPRKLNRILTSI